MDANACVARWCLGVVVGLLARVTAQDVAVDVAATQPEGMPFVVRANVTGVAPEHAAIVNEFEFWDGKAWVAVTTLADPFAGRLPDVAPMVTLCGFRAEPPLPLPRVFVRETPVTHGAIVWRPGRWRVRVLLGDGKNDLKSAWREFAVVAEAQNRAAVEAVAAPAGSGAAPVTARAFALAIARSPAPRQPMLQPYADVAPPTDDILQATMQLAKGTDGTAAWRAFAALRAAGFANFLAHAAEGSQRAQLVAHARAMLTVAKTLGPEWATFVTCEQIRTDHLGGTLQKEQIERLAALDLTVRWGELHGVDDHVAAILKARPR